MAPPNRSWKTVMSVEVFQAACRFRRSGELVLFDELVNSPSLLKINNNMLGKQITVGQLIE
jgi:hypothetical protein